jgi:hypothetical protein
MIRRMREHTTAGQESSSDRATRFNKISTVRGSDWFFHGVILRSNSTLTAKPCYHSASGGLVTGKRQFQRILHPLQTHHVEGLSPNCMLAGWNL